MIMMSIMPTAQWPTQLWDPSQWETEVQSQGTLHAGIALLTTLFSCARHNVQLSQDSCSAYGRSYNGVASA